MHRWLAILSVFQPCELRGKKKKKKKKELPVEWPGDDSTHIPSAVAKCGFLGLNPVQGNNFFFHVRRVSKVTTVKFYRF